MSHCHEEPSETETSCHGEQPSCHGEQHGHGKRKLDWLLWSMGLVVVIGYGLHLLVPDFPAAIPQLQHFTHSIYEFVNTVWWGVAAGIVAMGLLGRIPREFVMAVLGPGGTLLGIFRATLGGVLLDLCSHGILLVGTKLYERGASAGQMIAFLVASPWNSLSLTLILIALIGWQWTLAFIGLSVVIAIVAGWLFDVLVRRGVLPGNPNTVDLPTDFKFWPAARKGLAATSFGPMFFVDSVVAGLKESRMVMRWILLGVVMAAALRAAVPVDVFADWFGPSLLGLGLTIVAATILEVCSEGSSPIAADLLTRAAAPGNSFAFLMTGVATDYTEILVVRETTKSWRLALFLPLLTVPQVLVIAWLLNQVSL